MELSQYSSHSYHNEIRSLEMRRRLVYEQQCRSGNTGTRYAAYCLYALSGSPDPGEAGNQSHDVLKVRGA